MSVYTLHRLSMGEGTVTPMEEFPSVERAMVAFQTRARRQASAAFFMDGQPTAWPRPEVAFPGADLTGYMVVWRRGVHEMPPKPTDTPDELWRLSPGGAVRREPWGEEHKMPEIPRQMAATPEADPFHGDVVAVEAEFTQGNHPPFGAVGISYWWSGRMELKVVASGPCTCKDPSIHVDEVKILATVVDAEAYGLPSGTVVWHVRTGAPDASHAQKMARTVAKGLGYEMNPVLSEMGQRP